MFLINFGVKELMENKYHDIYTAVKVGRREEQHIPAAATATASIVARPLEFSRL